MRKSLICLVGLSAAAYGQSFEPYYATQWGAYFLSVDNPEYCEGLSDGDVAGTSDWEPFQASWDRSFRCVSARGSVHGYQRTSVTDTEILCQMGWVGDLSAEQVIPGGSNNLYANGYYMLAFETPGPTRVHLQGTVHLDYDSFPEPGQNESAMVRVTVFTGSRSYIVGQFQPGEAAIDRSFDTDATISDGRIEVMIFEAHIAQDTALHTGAEHFTASARFSMEVIFCPGDVDADNVVSLSDLATLLPNMGLPGHRSDGDLNGDGAVDLTDLTQLLARFGSGCPL